MEKADGIGGRSVSLALKLGNEQTKSNILRPIPNVLGATSAKPFGHRRQGVEPCVSTGRPVPAKSGATVLATTAI
jgi:hypothetical protein